MQIEQRNKTVVTIGLAGFPYGMAASHKLLLMGKALVLNGYDFLVISNTFLKKSSLNSELKQKGEVDGVKYVNTCPFVFSPGSAIKKIFGKIAGKLREFFLINSLIRKKQLKAVFLYSPSFFYVKFWSIYLRLRKCKSFLIYFELRSAVEYRTNTILNFNDKLFDRYSFKHVNGVITITEYLTKHVLSNYPEKPIIKVPPIVDFEKYSNSMEERRKDADYFLYCGSIAYIDVIYLIIDAFSKIALLNINIKLVLVVNGNSEKIEQLKAKIQKQELSERIVLRQGLTDEELIRYYLYSHALLIPLRDTIQDKARFPHKIAEYCASKRPIISNKGGEMDFYFDDRSAFLAERYDVDDFALQMQKTIENQSLCIDISNNSYAIGKKYFEYKSYSIPLTDFIEKK